MNQPARDRKTTWACSNPRGFLYRLAGVFAAVLLQSGCAAATSDGVTLSESQEAAWFEGLRSGGARIDDGPGWDAWLDTPWISDTGEMIRFRVHLLGGGQQAVVVDEATVDTCMQLFDADLRSLQPPMQRERVPYAGLRRQCYAARVISEGLKAETSFVTDFDMDEPTFRNLPAQLVTVMSPGRQAERVDEIVSNGGTLGDAIDYTMDKPSTDASDVERLKQIAFIDQDGWRQDWTWLARGDFNRDGVEDLLVSSRLRAPVGEHLDDYRLFLLTRRAADSPIELLQEIPLASGDETGLCSEMVIRCGRDILR